MNENWMLGVGHYDSFDRGWVLCRGVTGIPYKTITPKDMDEAIETCIKKNKDFNPNDPFNDHYGVIRYKLEEHGLIAQCIEVWCPYDHKDRFQSSTQAVKEEVEG